MKYTLVVEIDDYDEIYMDETIVDGFIYSDNDVEITILSAKKES